MGGGFRGVAAAISGLLTLLLSTTYFNKANVESSSPQRLQFAGERFKAHDWAERLRAVVN